MTSSNRIAQIIPYFGKWPEWIDLYFYSCSRNSFVDFIFYTDCIIPEIKADNLKFINISYAEYCKTISQNLNINFQPKNTYKLTDLKPFLGKIHEDILSNYEWWGFGDLDLVYGDLRMILSKKNLKRYNLITTHNYHIAGHCTFMRNNDYYRNLCFKIKDWRAKLEDNMHYGLDEADWSGLVYRTIKYPLAVYRKLLKHLLPKSFNTFMNISNAILHSNELFKEFHTTPAPMPDEIWKYDILKNRIFSPNGTKLPYLHFLFFKKTPWYDTDLYWREGYWKINGKISDYKTINISLDGITGEQ